MTTKRVRKPGPLRSSGGTVLASCVDVRAGRALVLHGFEMYVLEDHPIGAWFRRALDWVDAGKETKR